MTDHGLLAALADPDRRAVVLLGGPGSGKSTSLRYLAVRLTRLDPGPDLAPIAGHLPVLIELRSCAESTDSFLDHVDHLARTDGLGLSRSRLEPYLAGGGEAIFLFDGLDEIVDPVRRAEISTQIADFANSHRHVRVVVTSRMVGYQRRAFTEAGFDHLILRPFSENRVETFIRAFYSMTLPVEEEARARADRVLETIRQSPRLAEMAGNPLLLSVMAVVSRQRMLPRDRARLYEFMIDVLVGDWDTNRRLGPEDAAGVLLDLDDKKELLSILAYRMLTEPSGAGAGILDAADLVRYIATYLVDRYGLDRAQAELAARIITKQFQERNPVLTSVGPAHYTFTNRAFLDFLAARAIVGRFQNRTWSPEQLRETAVAHRDDPNWQEVLSLIAESLGDGYLAYELNEVFKANGTPTLTFVEPDDFTRFRMALRQPGLGIVVEGPSGIGKTTFLRQAELRERERGVKIRMLTARDPSHLEEIKALPEGHSGTVSVDDFHRLEPTLRARLIDYLKLLADEESPNRLIILGIPGVSRSLVELSFDLATRIEVFRLERASAAEVGTMIEQGERTLNVALTHKDEIIAEADGSLQTAQMLCWYVLQQAGVESTRTVLQVVDTALDEAIRLAESRLTGKFQSAMTTFVRFDGVCIELLRLLSHTDDGILTLDTVRAERPDLAPAINTKLLQAFPEGFGPDHDRLTQHLYLDPAMRLLVADDPQLLFYLRHQPFERMMQAVARRPQRRQIFISYSHRDVLWRRKLEPHLEALAGRGRLDYWADTRIKPSASWLDEIEEALDRAAGAVLLVTPNFLASPFVRDVEMRRLLTRANAGGCQVWQLIVRPSVVSGVPELARLQTFNEPTRPLSKLRPHQQDEVMRDLALALANTFPGDVA